jgi:histidyl-tRNA synthetase
MSKPAIPKGTRDFLPVEMARRNYIFDTIRSVYRQYGFQPIETPAMENTETLMGKYGEEGDRLIFRILNSGEFLKDAEGMEMTADNSLKVANRISEKALRYDLTVPFARFVVQHQNEISFPFKRYQIQPVWRADRPQKGRYREFYQCDADVVGSDSLLYEVEIVHMIHQVFRNLGVKVRIQMNNRKILKGLAQAFNAGDKATDLFVAMDKYEKIGDAIYDELREKGFGEDAISDLRAFIATTSSTPQEQPRLDAIRRFFEVRNIADGLKGVEELAFVLNIALSMYGDSEKPNVEVDVALARGLNYYTGAIFEVKADEGEFRSSICGGGRYDDLTGIFGMKGMSGVGISFGADRIYDVLMELNRFPELSADSTQVLVVNFGGNEGHLMKIASDLRAAGLNAEVYPDTAKMKKQFGYADNKQIPWVVIMGEDEEKRGVVQLKNMKSGDQREVALGELAAFINLD